MLCYENFCCFVQLKLLGLFKKLIGYHVNEGKTWVVLYELCPLSNGRDGKELYHKIVIFTCLRLFLPGAIFEIVASDK